MEQKSEYEEISVVELIVLWVKHWKLALCSGLVVAVLGLGYIAMLKPVYESHASFKVGGGRVGPSAEQLLLVEPAVLAAELKALHGMGGLPRLENVSFDKRSSQNIDKLTDPVIHMVARAYSAEVATEFLNEVLSGAIEEQGVLYLDYKTRTQKLYEKLLTQAGSNGEALNELQRDLILMQPSKLLSKPSLPSKPVSSKNTKLYAVAVLLGLMVMFILPFILSFIASVRAELQRQTEKQ